MANFDPAFDIVMGHEGGYVNDVDDPGKETYRGISRRFHPDWEGWGTVDRMKHEADFPGNLINAPGLDFMVRQFYRAEFWDTLSGDRNPSQSVANELFEIGVNLNPYRAGLFLQCALNVLNINERLYPDIEEDGMVRGATLEALASYLRTGKIPVLLTVLNVLQGRHYYERMRARPDQEKWRGWFGRVTFERA